MMPANKTHAASVEVWLPQNQDMQLVISLQSNATKPISMCDHIHTACHVVVPDIAKAGLIVLATGTRALKTHQNLCLQPVFVAILRMQCQGLRTVLKSNTAYLEANKYARA